MHVTFSTEMMSTQEQEMSDRMDAIQYHLALNSLDEPTTSSIKIQEHSYVLWNNKGGVGMILIILLFYLLIF